MMTDRRQALAEATGLSPESLEELKETVVDALVRKGVLVTVHVGRWRARHKLAPEDLGLDQKAARTLSEALDLGHKLLLPRPTLDDLARLESAGRANLARHSLDSRLGAFVSDEALPRFLEAHERLRRQYLGIRDSIVEQLPRLRDAAVRRFQAAAKEIYNRLRPDAAETVFVEKYVDRALAHWPSANQICGSFYFDAKLALVPLASELAREQARLAELREDERVRDELRRQFADERRRQIDGFLTDVVSSLRATVYKAVTTALRTLDQHDAPAPRTIASLRRLVERVRLLNVYGDQEIESQLGRLEQALVPAKRRTPVTAAKLRTALVELSKTTEEAVREAFHVDPLLRRFSLLDLSADAPAPPADDRADQTSLSV
jgi:hypothetical protein